MVYASVMTPPAFGQKLESFDDTAAKQVNGVSEVFEFDNKIVVIGNSTWAAMKGKSVLSAQWSEDTPLESTDYHNTEMDGQKANDTVYTILNLKFV